MLVVYGVTLGFLLPSLALWGASSGASATPTVLANVHDLTARDVPVASYMLRRDEGHEHAHHNETVAMEAPHGHAGGHSHPSGPAKLTLDESDSHPPPPSYWTVDFDSDPSEKRYPGFMLMHILAMCGAFFGALPVGIAMRSVNHAWHGASVIVFWALVIVGCASSSIYRKLTPNMYEGQVHSTQSYYVLLIALVLTIIDFAAGIGRLIQYAKDVKNGEAFNFRTLWRQVVLKQDGRPVLGHGPEYSNLVVGEPEDMELDDDMIKHHNGSRHVVFDDQHEEDRVSTSEEGQWANDNHDFPETPNSERTVFGRLTRTNSHQSHNSDETLNVDFGAASSSAPKKSLALRVGRIVFNVLERVLVFAAFGELTVGIAIYLGGCRGYRINVCLAHVIKGGIFWCYGLVTFARFLGSFSNLGWAWNRPPKGRPVSAEFVESAVIFTYGITNVWMERFGAAPGSPFTTKQIQHISIAAMYWFAGMVGMGMESRRLRRWLSAFATASMNPSDRRSSAVAEPASYMASYNPFPALCIGVTGIAMSAHSQNYVFQVQIHELWGYALAGFMVMRWATYFFTWLGPPRSILPSRPPSEAVGAFMLAIGGLVFMLSSEEITIGAMRLGHDDVMMFANAAVAFTCLAFCWVMAVVGVKAWLTTRSVQGKVSFHDSA
ncbi:hypothetical protein PENSPDRAFT_651980 [Peniophora sp. CONT]|nr:hypothetical protein PENSPDRAFT_651980 [Peniophora sp. CONT]